MPGMRAVAVATALALSAAGCGRPSQRPQPMGADAPCAGWHYIDVHNSFDTAVELYGYVGGASGVPRYLGSVAPGTQRIRLPEPVGSVYAEIGGRRVTQRGARPGEIGGIAVTRGCEVPD